MKTEHEVKLNQTEMSEIRWVCGVKLNERKKGEDFQRTVRIDVPIQSDDKNIRLRWFEHIELKVDKKLR